MLVADPTFLEQTDHQHDLSVTSVGFELVGDLDLARFNSWISALLAAKGVDIFRSKGILSVAGEDDQLVFQGVHMLIDSASGRAWGSQEERVSRLVFIGRHLDVDELERGIRRCLIGAAA